MKNEEKILERLGQALTPELLDGNKAIVIVYDSKESIVCADDTDDVLIYVMSRALYNLRTRG